MTNGPDSVVHGTGSALPSDWLKSWGTVDPFLARQQAELREAMEALAADLPFVERAPEFRSLVGSAELRDSPVHRWYYYKEGFSPKLPRLLIDLLGTGANRTVVDPFAGVATTPLSLINHPAVDRVIGVEYSPFATFVGKAKLGAIALSSETLSKHMQRIQNFPKARLTPRVPSLAAFHNESIFSQSVLHDLLKARDVVRADTELSEEEESFFLLGIAAVTEDLSGAMKDGRALRILKGRKRRRQGLQPTHAPLSSDDVRSVLLNQWNAMIEDLRLPFVEGMSRYLDRANHEMGNALSLSVTRDSSGEALFPDQSVGIHLYSPPYLNFLDYTEVYKLELWLLEMVTDQAGFRALREGTLRSHPSIQFPPRPIASNGAKVFTVIDDITEYFVRHLARPSIGHIVKQYFEDMFVALQEQYKTLEPGGSIACVVANSILSRREKNSDTRKEIWRMPILTDVLLARLAEAAGFVDIEIWGARTLQAKNVNGGLARESIVVARRPS